MDTRLVPIDHSCQDPTFQYVTKVCFNINPSFNTREKITRGENIYYAEENILIQEYMLILFSFYMCNQQRYNYMITEMYQVM